MATSGEVVRVEVRHDQLVHGCCSTQWARRIAGADLVDAERLGLRGDTLHHDPKTAIQHCAADQQGDARTGPDRFDTSDADEGERSVTSEDRDACHRRVDDLEDHRAGVVLREELALGILAVLKPSSENCDSEAEKDEPSGDDEGQDDRSGIGHE